MSFDHSPFLFENQEICRYFILFSLIHPIISNYCYMWMQILLNMRMLGLKWFHVSRCMAIIFPCKSRKKERKSQINFQLEIYYYYHYGEHFYAPISELKAKARKFIQHNMKDKTFTTECDTLTISFSSIHISYTLFSLMFLLTPFL